MRGLIINYDLEICMESVLDWEQELIAKYEYIVRKDKDYWEGILY